MFCHVSRAPLLDGREALSTGALYPRRRRICSASHRGVTICGWFTFPAVFRHTHSMWNTTAFSEKRSKSRSQRSMQKYQYFEWGTNLKLEDVQSQRNIYCYYNNVLLIPSPESPDDFATDVLLIIDWSMDIYDFCSDWSISSMDTAVVSLYPIEWLNLKVYLKDFIKRKIN